MGGIASIINGYVTPRTTGKAVVPEDLYKLVAQMALGDIMYFTSVADRNTKLATLLAKGFGAPPAGAISHLSTLGRYERFNGTSWVPLPYTEVVDAVDISADGSLYTTSGTTELDLGRLAHLSVEILLGQLYCNDIELVTSRTVVTDEFVIRLRRDTAVTGTLLAEATLWPAPAADKGFIGIARLLWTPAATATTTIFLSMARTAGTGTMSVFGELGLRSRSSAVMTRCGPSTRYRTVAV